MGLDYEEKLEGILKKGVKKREVIQKSDEDNEERKVTINSISTKQKKVQIKKEEVS